MKLDGVPSPHSKYVFLRYSINHGCVVIFNPVMNDYLGTLLIFLDVVSGYTYISLHATPRVLIFV